ncbi:hypothetical protein [Frondihabitans cladoniiphilus]|uniref:Uncharacterized protein n=1 Tax=Frondihabitans cladoniiphilus TaxID=715785 RepID=A0ABP8W9S4_9MICO
MQFYNLNIEFEKRDLSEQEIDEMYDNPIRSELHGALGVNPDGWVELTATVEASGMVAAMATALDRVSDLTAWQVRFADVMTTIDFDKKWGLDEMPFRRYPKKPWLRRLLTRS